VVLGCSFGFFHDAITSCVICFVSDAGSYCIVEKTE